MDNIEKQMKINCLKANRFDLAKAIETLRKINTPTDDQELFNNMCDLRGKAAEIELYVWKEECKLRRELKGDEVDDKPE